MLYNILAIGDVVGGCGVSCLEHHLRAVKNSRTSTSPWSTARMPRWSA